MYHTNIYTYQTKPIEYLGKYSIHQLDDEGLQKYLGINGHNFNYVSQIAPKVFKFITGEDYETVCQQQKDIIKSRSGSCPTNKKVDFTKQVSQQIPENIKTDNKNIKPDIMENNKEEEQCNDIKNYMPTFNPSQRHIFNPLKDGINKYHKRRYFKDIYGYNKIKEYKSKAHAYQESLNDLKNQKLCNDSFCKTHTRPFGYKRKYNEFTAYEIPRIAKNDDINLQSNTFKSYSKRLKKSMSCAQIKNKSNSEFETLRLDNIDMKNTLFNQTNKNFLNKYKLPDITKLADTRHKIRNFKLYNSKQLGEKYDPSSFVTPNRNRTGVNWVGALFQH